MANVMHVATGDNLQYQFYPVSSGSVQLKVRAPHDAHIALTMSPQETNPMIEVFIGGWSNSKSVIRKNRTKPEKVELGTPGILNAGEFRGFWLRWNGGIISCGHEGEAIPFLSWADPEPFPIHFIGVCTGWGATGTWNIEIPPSGPTPGSAYAAPPGYAGGAPAPGYAGGALAPGYPGGMSAPNYPGGAPSPSFHGGAPAPNYPGGTSSPNYPGGAPSSSYPGGAPAPNYPGGTPSSSYPGGAPSSSYPGGAPSSSYPGGAPTSSYPGGVSAPSYLGGGSALSYPSGAPASGCVGGAPVPGYPGGAPAPCGGSVWVNASGGQVPPGAVIGGQDCNGEPLYVARAQHEGAMLPGKLCASHGCAYVPWGGKEHGKPQYQVLVGGPNNWIPTSGANVPPGAFPGGQSEGGETLYIGRVRHEGSVTTGKVQQSHGVCYISFGGKELGFPNYEILMP